MTSQEFHAIRIALGMSQHELGRQIGRHRNSIAAYESGALPVPTAVARLIPYLLTASRRGVDTAEELE